MSEICKAFNLSSIFHSLKFIKLSHFLCKEDKCLIALSFQVSNQKKILRKLMCLNACQYEFNEICCLRKENQPCCFSMHSHINVFLSVVEVLVYKWGLRLIYYHNLCCI